MSGVACTGGDCHSWGFIKDEWEAPQFRRSTGFNSGFSNHHKGHFGPFAEQFVLEEANKQTNHNLFLITVNQA